MRIRHSIFLLLGTLFFFAISPTSARAADFKSWLNSLRAEALEKGISRETLDITYQYKSIPRVIELDRRQPEFTLTYKEYINASSPKRGLRRRVNYTIRTEPTVKS